VILSAHLVLRVSYRAPLDTQHVARNTEKKIAPLRFSFRQEGVAVLTASSSHLPVSLPDLAPLQISDLRFQISD
jgi:hypothetical protein